MSTENCKKFIEELSIKEHLPLKTTWKRTEKYKESSFTMRNFENKEGDTLLISENSQGDFHLVELDRNISIPESLKILHRKNHLLSELYKLYLDLTPYAYTLEDSLDLKDLTILSQNSIRKYLLLGEDKFLKEDLKTLSLHNKEELDIGYKILYQLSYCEPNDISLLTTNFVQDTSSENVGILYDKENMELSYMEKEGVSFFVAVCGGDWEMPIHFLVYWSETDKRLKGFFPKGDSNVYNVEYNCAYGSEYDKVHEEDFSSRAQYDKVMNEADDKMGKINDNFEEVSNKALNKAFKELKHIILNENLKVKNKP